MDNPIRGFTVDLLKSIFCCGTVKKYDTQDP